MAKDKQKDKPITRGDILNIAFGDMCKALDKFGPGGILDLLVIYSPRDEVVYKLLLQYLTVVAIGEFLRTRPTRKVDRRTFKRLQRKGYLILWSRYEVS